MERSPSHIRLNSGTPWERFSQTLSKEVIMNFLNPVLPVAFQDNIIAFSIAVAAAFFSVYLIWSVVHRLFFSPLAGFPGSKVAASTHFYEFYYDWWCHGRYIYEIEKMHEKYGVYMNSNRIRECKLKYESLTGPIVRVNPDELSIHDPQAYSDIYVPDSKRKTENYQPFSQGIGFDGEFEPSESRNSQLTLIRTGSHFLTTSHDVHRRRRRPLEPFFSRSGILRLQSLLAETTEKLVCRLEQVKGTGTVLRLDHVFFAMSGDVVGKLCWADKEEYLDDPNYAPEW